jgi:adenine-specific DNA-methyltransferase
MPTLHWLTKETDLKTAAKTPCRLLAEEENYSYGDPGSENIIVQGDNLEALKALLPFYAGQVKCIYIDPPYNTGSAFEHYDDNMEHTLWLSMMYPRLELLKQFLREDGFIFIQIDNNEMPYLKIIMDEIFGRQYFVNDIVWKRRGGSANPSNRLNNVTDYVLWYAKSSDYTINHIFSLEDDNTKEYIAERFNNIDENGRRFMKSPIQSPNPRPNLIYDYKGYKTPPKGYSISKEVMEQWEKEGKLWFPKNKNQNINRKIYLDEYKGQPINNLWTDIKVINPMAKERSDFDGQKPERLIQRILTLATSPGDLVLDSFLGSGTTAAVAHKMGRRYIGIEMGEQAKTHCVTRLKKVIDGEQGGISEAVGWKGGGGFRFFKLGEAIFDSEGRIKSDISFENLAAHIYFTETKTPMRSSKKKSAFLGIHNDTAFALLYNGILGDKSIGGGNVLTHNTLNHIMNDIDAASKKKGEPLSYNALVIYGEATRLTNVSLKSNNIIFKQTPYDIKVW